MDLLNNLIINADDFGYKNSVNKAIVKSFEKGYINSTTIMANMPAFDEAVELAHQHNIADKIGVHLVLTEGEPMTNEIKKLDYLFNDGLSLDMRLKKLMLINKDDKRLIYKEYSAQVSSVLKKGINITHVDTHHQIHDLFGITRILTEILKTYNIPCMRILNNLEKPSNILKLKYRNYINRYIAKKKVNFSNFLGDQMDFISVFDKNPSFLNNTKVEVMVHPVLNEDGDIKDKIGTNYHNIDFLRNIPAQKIKEP